MPVPTRPSIDLNADLGEGFGRYTLDGDVATMLLITSANVACGFHAGDPRTIDAAVAAANRPRGGPSSLALHHPGGAMNGWRFRGRDQP
jgi:hypothetical protein